MSDNIWEKQASMLRADLKVLQSFIDDLDDSKASEAFYNVRGSVIAYLHSGTPASPVRWPVVEFVDDLCARQVELPPDFAEVLHSMTNEPVAARELDVEAELRDALEVYAESYDMMARMKGGGNTVNCTSVAYDIRRNMVDAMLQVVRAARSAAQSTAPVSTEQAGDAWQPIETAPKTGRTLLLGRFNELGNWRTMRGQWFSQAAIDQEWEEPDEAEEGWYETAVEPDVPNCWLIYPTHWMPLPAAPSPNNSPVADKSD